MYPFSFQEFLSFFQAAPSEETFDRYLEEGGFPEYLAQKDRMILQNLFKDIILRDIAVRHGVRNIQTLMETALFLITNTGKETTYNSIRKQFNMGAANTAADYMHWLEDSWLIHQVQRFSWSVKARNANPRKIYGIDTGLIEAMNFFGLVEGIIITRSQNDTITVGDKIIQLVPAYQFLSKNTEL